MQVSSGRCSIKNFEYYDSAFHIFIQSRLFVNQPYSVYCYYLKLCIMNATILACKILGGGGGSDNNILLETVHMHALCVSVCKHISFSLSFLC